MNFLANPVCSWYQESFLGGSHRKESTYNAGDSVQSLSWEKPLEEEMATHASILARESHKLYSPWGPKELDMTERPLLSLVSLLDLK